MIKGNCMVRGIPWHDRFMAYVDIGENCWLWAGYKTDKGYGMMGINGTLEYTSRVSYRLFNGDIPDGLCICHSCDNPPCVNPQHLWIGTRKDNALDMIKKGRNKLPVLERSSKGRFLPCVS